MYKDLKEIANEVGLTGFKRIVFYVTGPFVWIGSYIVGYIRGYIRAYIDALRAEIRRPGA